MSGKPPSGKGRWNLGQSANKSNEKKDILKAIDDIYNILDGAEQQQEQFKENFSEILFRLSKISIPSKQTNLTKEIASSCRAIGRIPINLLKASDYANISRYLTRASAEKQLSLTAREAPLMYRLFAHFLHSHHFNNPSPEDQSNLLVLHEVMRAFAQLLAECGNHLYGLKSNLFEILFSYSSASYPDLEIRYSAIDALGNFYKSSSVTMIEIAALPENDSKQEKRDPHHAALLEDSYLSPAAVNEIQFLQTHLRKSLAVLVANLQFCAQFISNSTNFLEGSPALSPSSPHVSIAPGSEGSTLIQKLLVSVLRAIVFTYSSPFACFKGISTAVGKPAVLREFKWRHDIFCEFTSPIMESFLPILNHCLRSSPSFFVKQFLSHRADHCSLTASAPLPSFSSSSSLAIDVPDSWRSATPNSKYHHSTSTASVSTPTNSRPPSPTPSLSSVTTAALSPSRSKRIVSSDEIREKILQHAFYLLEALAKFDSVHVIRYWEVLFSDPSDTVATGRAVERCNLLDYLTDEVSISGDDSGEGRKSLSTCASALSALLTELPNTWTHQPPLLFPEVTSYIASCAVRNLTTLFLCDTSSQRILSYLSLFTGVSQLLRSSAPQQSLWQKINRCDCGPIYSILLHRSLELVPQSLSHGQGQEKGQRQEQQQLIWTVPQRRAVSLIRVATSILLWISQHVTEETRLIPLLLPPSYCALKIPSLPLLASFQDSFQMTSSQDEYLEYVTTRVAVSSATHHSHFSSHLQSTDTQTTAVSSSHATSFLQILLFRCQLLFGGSLVNQSHSHSQLTSSDPESDVGKEELAVLALVGIISQSSLSHLFPHFTQLTELLSHGFSCSRPEVRVLCLEIISSCLRNTVIPQSDSSPLTSPETSAMTSSQQAQSCWRIGSSGEVVVSSDWMFLQLQEVVVCANDVEAKVRLQAIHSLRSISYLWADWRRELSSQELLRHLSFLKVTEIHLQSCLPSLLKLLSDSSAEVVTSACKTLGEIIAKTSLWLDNEIFSFLLSSSSGDQKHCQQETIATLVQLAQDCHQAVGSLLNSPKIPIRIQAIWTFGNMIKNLLPCRMLTICDRVTRTQLGAVPGHMIGNVCYPIVEDWAPVCSALRWQEMRRQLCEIIEFDTEKMIPAALRALSFVTCGLTPLSAVATEYSRIISRLLFGSFTSSSSHILLLPLTSWQSTWTSDLILSHVLLQKLSHHKLLYSICQLLCSYLWSLLLYDSPFLCSLSPSEATTGADDLKSSEFAYQLLLCLFQQNHFAKIRIQSLKCLLVINRLLFEKISQWKSSSPHSSYARDRTQFYLRLCIRCVEYSLLLLLNWNHDILNQMDLTEEERLHFREHLISLLTTSLQCSLLSFQLYPPPPPASSSVSPPRPSSLSSLDPLCRDYIVSVLYHSIFDLVLWLQNEELLRFQTMGPSRSAHSSSSPLLDPNPVTIDSVLEIEVESSFIPSSPHYRSNIPNPHQREFLIIQSLSELSSPASVSLHPSPRPSASHSSGSGSCSAEKDDTVKELATLLLTIFHQCHALPLLQSLQISAVTTATAAPPQPTATLSSASPYAILISICDPSLSQCESRYGKMMTMISSSCSTVSPSLLPLIEEQSQGQGGDDDEEDEI